MTTAGLGRKGGGQCGSTSIVGEECSRFLVPGCPDIPSSSNSGARGREKREGDKSYEMCADLFAASYGED